MMPMTEKIHTRFETLAPGVRICHVTIDNPRRANSLNSVLMQAFVVN